MRNRITLFLFFIGFCFSSSFAQRSQYIRKQDSLQTNFPLKHTLKPQQVIVPCVFFAAGVAGIATGTSYYKAKDHMRGEMDIWRGKHGYQRFDDYVQYVPAAGYLTLGFIPELKKNDFGHRAIALATSFMTEAILVNVFKYTMKERRPTPNQASRHSFPSGHTATAFLGAELVRIEYGWGCGMTAYAVAGTIGFMRIYNGKHWFNDVIAGAGIGIVSAPIGYWLLPYTEKILPRKYRYNQLAIFPKTSQQGNMEVAIRFGF